MYNNVNKNFGNQEVYVSLLISAQLKHLNCLKSSNKFRNLKTNFVAQSGSPDQSGSIGTSATMHSGNQPLSQDSDNNISVIPTAAGMMDIGTTLSSNTDAVIKDVSMASIKNIPNSLRNSAGDHTNPSITFYLQKPVVMITGDLATTDSSSTFVERNVFEPLLSRKLIKDKISGLFAFRATCVFTLQINATRFQQGRYILAYLPYAGANTTTGQAIAYSKSKRFTATQVTQLLHVEIDLATDTQVQLKVPYLNYANSTVTKFGIATTYTDQTPGTVFMYPYKALQAGSGDITAAYTLWEHFEDIELFGNMSAQMGDFFSSDAGMSSKMVRKTKDALHMEMTKTGPIEGGANMVRKLADQATKLPLLSAIAAPVSWFADVVGGVCSIFGWSKPMNLQPATRTNPAIQYGFANSNNLDNVESLSLTSGNHIDVLPGFAGSDVDELSIDYLKNIYAFYRSINWSATTHNAGDTLAILPLAPSYFANSVTDTTNKLISNTPISWLGSFFQFYRGGLKFKLKLVKTEFHSGRLAIGFYPCDATKNPTTALALFSALDYVQKTIVDVRYGNEWEIEVPYISTTPWKKNGRVEAINNATSNGPGDFFGYLAIFVLTPLKAPDSVESSVTILLEVKGAEDLEFAVPIHNPSLPIFPLAINLSPQMGDTGLVSLGCIGDSKPNYQLYKNAESTMGEPITSLRQLLKRPTACKTFNMADANVSMCPDVNGIYTNVTPGLPSGAHITTDNLTQIAPAYALYRGSYRYKFVPNNPAVASVLQVYYDKIKYLYNPPSAAIIPFFSYAVFQPYYEMIKMNMLRTVFRTEWGVGWNIPFYSNTHSKPVINTLVTPTGFWLFDGSSPDTIVTMNGEATSGLNGILYRYAGDDYNLGYFTGAPITFPTGTL